jgi:hypothetical protein
LVLVLKQQIVVDPVGIVEPMKVTVEPLTEYALGSYQEKLVAATAGSANAASTVAANQNAEYSGDMVHF